MFGKLFHFTFQLQIEFSQQEDVDHINDNTILWKNKNQKLYSKVQQEIKEEITKNLKDFQPRELLLNEKGIQTKKNLP